MSSQRYLPQNSRTKPSASSSNVAIHHPRYQNAWMYPVTACTSGSRPFSRTRQSIEHGRTGRGQARGAQAPCPAATPRRGARYPKKGRAVLCKGVRIKYRFINDKRHEHAVPTMCRVLRLSRSAFYQWLHKPLSGRAIEDLRLLELIRASYAASGGVYGAPRVVLDLREAGERRVRDRDKGCPLAASSTLNRLELSDAASAAQNRYMKIAADPQALDRLLVDLFLESYKKLTLSTDLS